MEASDRGINRLEPTTGGNRMRPRLACSFSKLKNPHGRYGLTSNTTQQSTLASLRLRKKRVSIHIKNGISGYIE